MALLFVLAGSAVAAPKGEEVAVYLDKRQQLTTRLGSFPIFIHDHGSESISVSVNYGPYTKLKKALGTDTVGDNKVLIYSNGTVLIYHVNTPRAPQNCCLLEVARAQ